MHTAKSVAQAIQKAGVEVLKHEEGNQDEDGNVQLKGYSVQIPWPNAETLILYKEEGEGEDFSITEIAEGGLANIIAALSSRN